MHILKEKIITKLLEQDIEQIETDFDQYENIHPHDIDMYLLKGYYYMLQGDYNKSSQLLLFSIKHNPYDVDTYFLLGELSLITKSHFDAISYFLQANSFYTAFQQEYLFYDQQLCKQKINDINQELSDQITSLKPEQLSLLQEKLSQLKQQTMNNFNDIIRNGQDIIGKHFHTIVDQERYCGYYNVMDDNIYGGFPSRDLRYIKGELLKICYEGTQYHITPSETTLLPIAAMEPETLFTVTTAHGDTFPTIISGKEHFNYYRISEPMTITSQNPLIIGEPVKLGYRSGTKKLVISFFVDGLSQKLLEEENLKEIMPYTYSFFSKGLLCKNFFTNSDWTYPTLPSFVSGLELPTHMMFHPIINKSLPTENKILFEYFKEAGYYTAMFNGDWRSSATYGYTRGIDRYVTQNAYFGMRADQVISDALDHIRAFRETNQYLWITCADLHIIADEYDLPASIQTQLDITSRKEEKKAITSIKQDYSIQKRKAYIEALKLADLRFQPLYDYIEHNYSDDEFVITMFGDHGQTYLLKPGEHPLSRYHSNVGFMIRGGGYQGICEEYMSSVDYPSILCKLANIDTPVTQTEGILPKYFGGNEERNFTLTETIHPNDPYMASIHAKDHTFYLTTENKLAYFGRLEPGKYTAILLDGNGEIWNNPELTEYYVSYLRDHLKYILQY